MIATAPMMLLPTIIEMMVVMIAPLLALASTISTKAGEAAQCLAPILDELMVKPLLRSLGAGDRKKVVAYLRFSTAGQSEDSIERQMMLLYQAADRYGLEIVDVFVDRGVSGVHASRPGLDAALAHVRSGRSRGLFVEDCDRLARRCSIIPTLFDELRDIDCELWDRHHGHIDTAMKASLLAGMAAEDHRKIVERTTFGRRQKIEAGAIFHLPFGYARDENTGEIEIVPAEKEILLRINADLRANINTHAIARALNAEEIPSPAGTRWSAYSVQCVASHLLQAGEYVYGKYKPRSRKAQKLPTVRVQHPKLAIMSQEDFAAAMQAMRRRRIARPKETCAADNRRMQLGRRLRESSDILHSKMACATCGRQMYYREPGFRPDGSSKDYFCADPLGLNKHHAVPANLVRQMVVATIAGELTGEAFEARFAEYVGAARAAKSAAATRSRASLSNRIAVAREEITRSFDDPAWGRGFSENEKAARRQELERRVRTASAEREALDAQADAIVEEGKRMADLKTALDTLCRDGLPRDDSRQSQRQRALVGAVLHDVVVHPCEDGMRFRLSILLAPGGDAGSPRAELMLREREIFVTRNLTAQSGLYQEMKSVAATGRWTLSEREFAGVLKAQPALREGLRLWGPEEALELMNSALICNAVGLPATHLCRLTGWKHHRGRFTSYALARSGALPEFFRAAAEIDADRFGSLDPDWPVVRGRRSHVAIPS